jgi:protein TonB
MRATGFMAAALVAMLATVGSTTALAQNMPKPLKVANDRDSWITHYDYPDLARRRGIQGVTTYRLEIDANGQVTGCTIVISSGSELLDNTTCRLLRRRARFLPAQDGAGKNIPASYTSRFNWSL